MHSRSPPFLRLCRRRQVGFTLIELLVAVGILALMSALSWRGLDAMSRSQERVQARADQLLTLQAGLAQWSADLDAIVQLPGTDALDWDGRALRITRHTRTESASSLMVVAWARRDVQGTGQWLRWQSPPVATRAQLQVAWARAAQWGQNPGVAERQLEVAVVPLEEWRVFYFRGDAWTNPLSSDGAGATSGAPPAGPATPVVGPSLVLPDAVRLVLTLPPGGPVSGTLTRDWMRPTMGGGKS